MESLPVLGVQVVAPEVGLRVPALERVAEDALGRLADEQDLPGRSVRLPHDRGQPVHETVEPPSGVERRGQRLRAAALRLGEPLRVLEGERRLVGEGLEQPDVFLVEAPARAVPHHERSGGAVAAEQRHRERGAMRRCFQSAPERGKDRDGWVVEKVRRHDRPALVHGTARDADPRRERQARRDAGRGLAGDGDREQVAEDRLDA